jgi:TPR repeat protein
MLLGVMYRNGLGTPEDNVEAALWYRLAAEQGYADAQVNLGVMYSNGQGVPEDDVEAVKWYRLAAEQGLAEAQTNLGVMYDNGEGVPEDDAEAVKWYRKAAEQGFAEAQTYLGGMYNFGHGVTQDLSLAFYWWRKSAEQGDVWAQDWIGDMYRTGEGVERDHAAARSWYERAAAKDYNESMSSLAKLLATSPDAAVRDGEKALHWIDKAIASWSGRLSEFHDVRALALAEMGRFPAALAELETALALYRAGKYVRGGRLTNHEQVYAAQREAFLAGQAWRSPD